MPETKKINPVETLQSFMHRKTVQESHMELEAQRLVNVFRHLNVFGDSYIEPFNQQLLSAPQEVIMLLPTIVGGSLVRQYAEYLNRQLGMMTENGEDMSVPQGEDGYLPSPEDDIPFVIPQGGATSAPIAVTAGAPVAVAGLSAEDTIQVLDKIVTAQGQMFADTLEKITVQTQETAARQTAAITKALADTQRSYYAVIEEPSEASAPVGENAPAPVTTAKETAESEPVFDAHPFDVDAVAAELLPESETSAIPTVIDEPVRQAFKPQSDSFFEPDEDIEILSEIDLPNE